MYCGGRCVSVVGWRTLANQFAEHPFQHALATRAGTECVAHVVQALTSLDPSANILSIDGVGAYDSISRRAMFRGLMDMVDGKKLVPFVRLFYDSPSTYIWEDEVGDVRHVLQGEGGEQGNPLMPLLFSLGQHRAIVAVQASLLEGERLFAFLDDIYIVCAPSRVGVHLLLQGTCCKTKIWNAGGLKPPVTDFLTARDRAWCGDPTLDVLRQDSNVLGVPIGHPQHVAAQLHQKDKNRPLVRANSACRRRANCTVVVNILRGNSSQLLVEDCPHVLHIRNGLPGQTQETASLPLTLGSLGVAGSSRVREAALLGDGEGQTPTSCMMTGFRSQRSGCLSSVTGVVNRLLEVGVHVLEWQKIADGLRPEDLGLLNGSHAKAGDGNDTHPPRTIQGTGGVASPFFGGEHTALPIHRISRMDLEPFRMLLLRRLRMPLPLNVRACRCGCLLDVLGHHRAACSMIGELGKRGFAAESAVTHLSTGATNPAWFFSPMKTLQLHYNDLQSRFQHLQPWSKGLESTSMLSHVLSGDVNVGSNNIFKIFVASELFWLSKGLSMLGGRFHPQLISHKHTLHL